MIGRTPLSHIHVESVPHCSFLRKAASSHGPIGIAHLPKLSAGASGSLRVIEFDLLAVSFALADVNPIDSILVRAKLSFMVDLKW